MAQTHARQFETNFYTSWNIPEDDLKVAPLRHLVLPFISVKTLLFDARNANEQHAQGKVNFQGYVDAVDSIFSEINGEATYANDVWDLVRHPRADFG